MFKPELAALEACHRLALSEGQKENRLKKRDEELKALEKSEIERLAEEKAKRAARKEAGRIALIVMTPLSLIAIVVALHLPGAQGPLLTILLFVVLAAVLFVANDTLYPKYYKRFVEELCSSKKGER